MTAISLHPTPEPRTVAREELGAVGLALRKEIIGFLVALALLAAFGIIAVARDVAMHPAQHTGHGNNGIPYGPAAAIPVALIGLLLPFGVWRAEDPARRGYFWAMPVARGPHTLVKMLSGWTWLMAGVAVYLGWILGLGGTIALISGGPVRLPAAAAWEWLVPFTAATVAYLLGSLAVIGSEHPWRWIGGLIILWIVGVGFASALRLHDVARAIMSIVQGYYGLSAAIFGNVVVNVAGEHVSSLTRWLGATLVWGVPAAIGVWIASYRRQDH